MEKKIFILSITRNGVEQLEYWITKEPVSGPPAAFSQAYLKEFCTMSTKEYVLPISHTCTDSNAGSLNGSTQPVANQAAADKMASDNPTATFYIIAAGMMNNDKDPAVPAKGYFIANNGVATLTQYLPA